MRQHLSSLSAAGAAMADARGVEELLLVAAQAARRLTGATYSSIGFVEGAVIHWQSAAGKPIEEVRGYRLPVSEGLCGWVVRNGRSRCSDDVTREPDYFLQYAEMQSELDEPIVAAGEVIGVLSCESPGIAAFTAIHETLLQVLAGYLARVLIS